MDPTTGTGHEPCFSVCHRACLHVVAAYDSWSMYRFRGSSLSWRMLSSGWFGRECVYVCAGSDIIGATHEDNRGLVLMSGTSMAAPLVAGVVAQLLQLNPDTSAREIVEMLKVRGLRVILFYKWLPSKYNLSRSLRPSKFVPLCRLKYAINLGTRTMDWCGHWYTLPVNEHRGLHMLWDCTTC